MSKVYPYITLSNGTKIEFLLAVWKNSKKYYLVGPILNSVHCKWGRIITLLKIAELVANMIDISIEEL